jgi:hypothetical protein
METEKAAENVMIPIIHYTVCGLVLNLDAFVQMIPTIRTMAAGV